MLCRRSDQNGLDKLVADIQAEGGEATGFLLNAIQPDTIEKLVEAIEQDTGPIETVIYNLGAQIGDRALADTSYKAFEMGWRIATQGLFRLASSVCPLMEARGHGTIIVTSATAAVRGNAGQHSHACSHGRAPHALPVAQCGDGPQRNSRGPCAYRWRRRCAGHPG